MSLRLNTHSSFARNGSVVSCFSTPLSNVFAQEIDGQLATTTTTTVNDPIAQKSTIAARMAAHMDEVHKQKREKEMIASRSQSNIIIKEKISDKKKSKDKDKKNKNIFGSLRLIGRKYASTSSLTTPVTAAPVSSAPMSRSTDSAPTSSSAAPLSTTTDVAPAPASIIAPDSTPTPALLAAAAEQVRVGGGIDYSRPPYSSLSATERATMNEMLSLFVGLLRLPSNIPAVASPSPQPLYAIPVMSSPPPQLLSAIPAVASPLPPCPSHSHSSPPSAGCDETNQTNLCIICCSNSINAAVIPCGHLAMCMTCARKEQERTGKCPICRVPATKLLQTYMC